MHTPSFLPQRLLSMPSPSPVVPTWMCLWRKRQETCFCEDFIDRAKRNKMELGISFPVSIKKKVLHGSRGFLSQENKSKTKMTSGFLILHVVKMEPKWREPKIPQPEDMPTSCREPIQLLDMLCIGEALPESAKDFLGFRCIRC